MQTDNRRNKILAILADSSTAISASALADELSVSRQIIVGDVAILRASGNQISATPRGYILEDTKNSTRFPYEGLIAAKHTPEQLEEELYTIVDFGGYVIDVTIEHLLYGQLSGLLNIASRHDVDQFIKAVEKEKSKPLSLLTDGIHLHRVGCKDEETFLLIKEALASKKLVV